MNNDKNTPENPAKIEKDEYILEIDPALAGDIAGGTVKTPPVPVSSPPHSGPGVH